MSELTAARRERGWMLAQQGRAELAEREYRLALADDPHDAHTHALLAMVLAAQEPRQAEALTEARIATAMAPDDSFTHYAEAEVHLDAQRYDEAQRAAERAIRLDPDHPGYYIALSTAHLLRRRWQDALNAADQALAIDPTLTSAANMRATALVQMGRRDEAGAALQGALARNPENSHTHANQGWALLHQGDRAAALEHFREALRLNPESQWARQGLVEVLKARNPLYAGMLRYFLWMNRLPDRTRWMIILGGWLGYRILDGVSEANPALAPWLVPVMIAYLAFVLLSWTAPEIFNAVLLASKDGRWVLSPEQRRSGAWMAAGVAAAVAATAGWLVVGEWLYTGAIMFAVLLIPLAATFHGPRGRPTRGSAIITAVLYAMAAAAVVLDLRGVHDVATGLFVIVVLGVVASTWGYNLRGG